MNTTTQPRTASAKTWFITGATSGIGRELMLAALRRGDHVAALARNIDGLDDLAQQFDATLITLAADVRDDASVRAAVQRTVEAFDRIDVVANNAGYGLFGAVEEASDAQARAIFDTNVFGNLNVLRATLPVLRAQRSGHILQGSSVYGQSAHPGVGLLSATKYAVEGLSDALADEVAPLGIRVTIVEPQFAATAFLSNLETAEPNADYDHTVRTVHQAIGRLPASAFAAPADIAAAVLRAVDAGTSPLRLALGATSAENIRIALNARMRDLDAWTDLTAAAA
ncbi:SDR family NAD(P)-dependent oxidoreductase [Couchioplanes caeruleus]|uniref:Short-chain dehydrogenase/reductase n=2 Tax=Couchioplanes caeruleus TaxID=56438 RepID=A0A1K0FC20_9ACTN|nr:SDR family NAD(P)-dependent oxidoreductase [Couchioplanes caeruleus]OJF10377.1 short-chain dehydrogenase/reductase [Couchioplanes caeruleus subsp. caeruleus]ROP29761.1 NADP-dependent 3-hydroxy acid dehydrogenase YdfG [Couchioplanes caeruleus]